VIRCSVFALAVALLCQPATAQPASARPPAAPTDLDALMARALQRRDADRQRLQDYVLDETERFDVLGAGGAAFKRSRREYTWYVRDGIHVRSPLEIDGIPVSETDRRKYEDDWFRDEQARRKNRAERQAERTREHKPPAFTGPIDEPRFVSESYFMDFKFEPGNYYLAGRDRVDGRDVLKIDYYPTRLFEDDDVTKDAERPKQKPGKDQEDPGKAIERKMNKTALVTLWVDPESAQIVKYTFENVWMDFLPGSWLVRVDDIRASMEMEQPFPGVWLPRNLAVEGGVTLAPGSFSVTYRRDYRNYREANVSSRIKIPKRDR
jgi:hypothetical protein